MKKYLDAQVQTKAHKTHSLKLMDRLQRQSIDKQVEMHNQAAAQIANAKRIEKLENAKNNKELNILMKDFQLQQQTARTVSTSPLMKFGASVNKEDVAKARAQKI